MRTRQENALCVTLRALWWVLIATCLVVCQAPRAYAGAPAPTTAPQKLRAEYVRLRNIDPTSDDPAHKESWETLAAQMEQLVARGSIADDDRVRLDCTDILLRLWRVERRDALLERANSLLQPVLERRDSPHLGEAAIRRAELGLAVGASESSVRKWVELAGRSGTADRRRVASLLTGLELGLFEEFVPSGDIEVPRPRLTRTRVRTGATGRPRVVVTIDPGHGGDDSGAVGIGGLLEKDVTFDIADRVRGLLEAEGFTVALTRERDEFVPLARRTAIANRKGAQVFVSLHNNASPSHELNGLESYYLDNTDDQASRKLAERENSVVPGGDVDDLSFILSDLIQSGKLEDSIRLTRIIDDLITRRVVQPRAGMRSLGVKRAPFFVLVGAHMPCTLVEMFFIDHAGDGKNLKSSAFRDTLARALAAGIMRFVRGETARASIAPDVTIKNVARSTPSKRPVGRKLR